MTRSRSAEAARLVTLLGAATLIAGCSQFGTTGIQLRVDTSITITSPIDRSNVTVPLQVSWIDDAPTDGGSYVVLIDSAPMPPGEDVAWFARDDDECRTVPSCPDERWLARRGITVTTETSVSIEIVPPPTRDGAAQEVTVVRLGPDGRRSDEAAFVARFEVDR